MFERITDKPGRNRSRLALILSFSVTVHGAVALSLLIVGMWQVEKLVPPKAPTVLVVSPPPPKIVEREPKPNPPIVHPDKVHKKTKVRKEMVQPDQNAPDAEDDDAYDVVYDADAGDDQDGDSTGGGGGTGNGGPPCIGWNCDGAPPPVEIPKMEKLPEPPKPPKSIPAEFLDGKRIAGNAKIMPPDSVRVSMYRNDERRIVGTIKMCLDTRGRVSSLSVLSSTGYEVYDRKLQSEMKFWRYRPYQLNNEAIPVCAPITFVYVMAD